MGEAFGNRRELAQDGSLPPTGRGGARPLQGIGGVRGEVRSPRPTEAPQVVPSIRADVGIGPYETGGKSPHPPGQRRTAKRLRCGWEEGVRSGAGIIPKGPLTSDNPSVSLAADNSLYTREPWGRGMRIATSALRASSQ